MLITDIEKNKDKIYDQDEYDKFLVQSSSKRGDLYAAVKVI